jgi:hypothetical protein
MPDPELVQRIRTIFLHPRPYVSIGEAAWILGWSAVEMEAAIAEGDVEVTTTGSGQAVEVAEVLAKVREFWPMEVIEEALAGEAVGVLPLGLRMRRVVIRLPLYQSAMLGYLATQRDTTVGHLLSFHLDELASEHYEELSAAIPGFREAVAWPHGGGALSSSEASSNVHGIAGADTLTNAEYDELWAEEGEARYARFLAGQTTAIDGPEVFARARSRSR